MNAKLEQKEKSHETILESASRLVRERGIAGASVADVMKGAGLTVGGFYAHFASKEELVDEALRRTGTELRERLFSRIEEKPEADRAEVVLKRYLSGAHRDAQTLGCPLPAVAGEIATTAGAHRAVLAEQIDALTADLEEVLPRNRGTRRALALGLVALMVGGLSLARALRGTDLSDEVIRACRALGAAAARGMLKT
jgi:TetR/AcrR family transcriptional regulator, transcriptional repressor for nem operon